MLDTTKLEEWERALYSSVDYRSYLKDTFDEFLEGGRGLSEKDWNAHADEYIANLMQGNPEIHCRKTLEMSLSLYITEQFLDERHKALEAQRELQRIKTQIQIQKIYNKYL